MKLPLYARFKQHSFTERQVKIYRPKPWLFFRNFGKPDLPTDEIDRNKLTVDDLKKYKKESEYRKYSRILKEMRCKEITQIRNKHVDDKAVKGFFKITFTKEIYYDQYQLYGKTKADGEYLIEQLNEWLKPKNSSYLFYKPSNHVQGRVPDGYDCWCEVFGDFLIDKGYRYAGATPDGGSVTEVWELNV